MPKSNRCNWFDLKMYLKYRIVSDSQFCTGRHSPLPFQFQVKSQMWMIFGFISIDILLCCFPWNWEKTVRCIRCFLYLSEMVTARVARNSNLSCATVSKLRLFSLCPLSDAWYSITSLKIHRIRTDWYSSSHIISLVSMNAFRTLRISNVH